MVDFGVAECQYREAAEANVRNQSTLAPKLFGPTDPAPPAAKALLLARKMTASGQTHIARPMSGFATALYWGWCHSG